LRLRGLLADPEVCSAAIAQVIATDPALTARLLRIANSPCFGLAQRVATVSRAVSVLGNAEIHGLALAAAGLRSLAALQPELVDSNEFWLFGVHCAVIARCLGRRFGHERGETLLVAGLLEGIGQVLLCRAFPAHMAALAAAADGESAAGRSRARSASPPPSSAPRCGGAGTCRRRSTRSPSS